MSQTTRLLRIFEFLWLIVAGVSLFLGIRDAVDGEGFNHYFIVTIALAIMGLIMYRVKRSGRKETEEYYRRRKEKESTK